MNEAGVPAARPTTDFTLLLDSTGRRDTGYPDEVPTLTVFPVIPGRADEMTATAPK